MIHRLSDFSDLNRYQLPFIVLKPSKMKFKELAVRDHDLKWPTVRFIMKHGGNEFRVKEFFLDWFFMGFPKSLLKDFASTYSSVGSYYVKGFKIFTGKNYRHHDSASAFIHGTQIEIDCSGRTEKDDFVEIFEDLLKTEPDPIPLSRHQFPDRSHFAKGYKSEWYEDLRISRLTWRRTPRSIYRMPGHELHASGTGFIAVEGKTQEIFILEERQYEKGVWVEIADEDIVLEHAFYNVRPGDGFYDKTIQLPENDGVIVFRSEDGPGILRLRSLGKIWTIAFSPGFSFEEIEYFASGLEKLNIFLDGLRRFVPQDEAYS